MMGGSTRRNVFELVSALRLKQQEEEGKGEEGREGETKISTTCC